MMSNRTDSPTPQYLKTISVLDCVPGHADRAESGSPIAILTIEHQGDIEQPMLLRMRDVRLLADRLISVLDHHGCPTATRIKSLFGERIPFTPFPTAAEEVDAVPTTLPPRLEVIGSVRASNDARPERLPSTGIFLRVRYGDPTPMVYEVVGGYKDETTMILLVNYQTRGTRPSQRQRILSVRPPNKVIVGRGRANEDLGYANWGKFSALDEGERLYIRGRKWIKMSSYELKKLAGVRRIFRAVYPTA